MVFPGIEADRFNPEVEYFPENLPWLNKKVEVRPVSYGKGLFLSEFEHAVRPGETILSFCGPYVPLEAADPLSLQVSLYPPLALETSEDTLYENYPNNACTEILSEGEEPSIYFPANCKIAIDIKRDLYDLEGKQSEVGEVTLVALREIQRGEELRFDYACTEINLGKEGEVFVCKCGSKSCRSHPGRNAKPIETELLMLKESPSIDLTGAAGLTLEEARYLYHKGLLTPHVEVYLIEKFGTDLTRRLTQ